MHRILVILVVVVLTAAGGGCASTTASDPEGEIRAVIDAQVEAWNQGDIEGYLDGYIRSPALVFASRGTFARGWDPLLQRYKVAYPEGEMGRLRMDGIEVHVIDEEHAWVIGSWWLDLADSTPHGAFTLIFRRTESGWKIIHDHSSGADLPAQE